MNVMDARPLPRLLPDSAIPEYSVLIRTFNSEGTLPDTLRSLAAQTRPPQQYVIVDSGSVDGTTKLAPKGSIVHAYTGREFNFSDALNQGISLVSNPYVLIISSHTTLQNADAVRCALELLESNSAIGAAYFRETCAQTMTYELIDRSTFDGNNGLWNTCSLIRVQLLRRRPFRPEVFASEDQEWARWLLHEHGGETARIWGGGMTYNNPRQRPFRKRLNEYVAVAYFANRSLLGLPNLARLVRRAVSPRGGLRLEDRAFNLAVFWRLVCCRFARPTAKSRYF
jgi:glycosyltransferase involved in cell wall biosynthesis